MATDTPNTDPNQSPTRDEMISLTTGIVSAYVSNNAVSTTDLPGLIETVYGSLNRVGTPAEPQIEQKPAVSVKKSVTNAAITCLECGKGQKMLKRHLATAHGLTPDEYRAKWNLPHDYPMVAPDYAEKRRDLAMKIGLGRKPAAAKKAPAKRKASGQKKTGWTSPSGACKSVTDKREHPPDHPAGARCGTNDLN